MDRLREQSMRHPHRVDIADLSRELDHRDVDAVRHAAAAARRITYLRPNEAAELRPLLKNVLSDVRHSDGTKRHARKAIEHIDNRSTGSTAIQSNTASDTQGHSGSDAEMYEESTQTNNVGTTDNTEVYNPVDSGPNYCPNCGTEVQQNAPNFCSHCGVTLDDS